MLSGYYSQHSASSGGVLSSAGRIPFLTEAINIVDASPADNRKDVKYVNALTEEGNVAFPQRNSFHAPRPRLQW